MHLTDTFDYFDGGTFQMLDLPYERGELSMVVFLPKEVGGLPALEQSLTASNVHLWLGLLQPFHEVIVTIPKFKMTRQVGLQKTLGAMGMPRAFDQDNADFSAMTGKRDLYISAVIHKAFIEVNEEGTEAAAATDVVIGKAMAAPPMRNQPPPPVFRADHPFLFLIRDNRSGGILFMGRVTDPTK
jgi:serpin B